MALCRNVLQEDDTLCELYSNTRSDAENFLKSFLIILRRQFILPTLLLRKLSYS